MDNPNTEANTSNQSEVVDTTTEKYPKLQELVAVLDKAMQDLNACVNPDIDAQDRCYSYEQVLYMLESYKDDILENQTYSLSGNPDMSIDIDTYADDLQISGTVEGEVDLSNLYSSDYEIEVELGDIDSPEDAILNGYDLWNALQVKKEEARLQAIADMTEEIQDESPNAEQIEEARLKKEMDRGDCEDLD